MVNAGAIMVCALIKNLGKDVNDIIKFYKAASQVDDVKLDYVLYQEEKLTGYTNHALTSLMLANNAFPEQGSPDATKRFAEESLDLYF